MKVLLELVLALANSRPDVARRTYDRAGRMKPPLRASMAAVGITAGAGGVLGIAASLLGYAEAALGLPAAIAIALAGGVLLANGVQVVSHAARNPSAPLPANVVALPTRPDLAQRTADSSGSARPS
jgi:hypothetical protein